MINFRFPINHKIKSKKEIQDILSTGKKWKCKDFTLFYSQNLKKFDRLAILISKKNGPAVYRNKIKRIFREIFRQSGSINPPYFNIVVIPNYSIDCNFKILREIYIKWRLF